jgi:hypothetical protein
MQKEYTMPQPRKDEPDELDVFNMVSAIGEGYAHAVYFTTRYRADLVETIAKTVPAPYTPDTPPTYVALQTHKIGTPSRMSVVHYTLAFDLWLQHDGGGATAARRGPPRDWRGRLEVPKRRR